MDDERWDVAAKAIAEATHLLIAGGAGLSADSGLPVYADVARTPAWRRRGLDYGDLCRTELLINQPAYGFGFWAACAKQYAEAQPHEGYAILETWARTKANGNIATYTSNVDGFFRRFPALSGNLCEIHGCAAEWTCGSAMGFASGEDGPGISPTSSSQGGMVSRGGVFAAHNAGVVERCNRKGIANRCSGASALLRPTIAELVALDRVCQSTDANDEASAIDTTLDVASQEHVGGRWGRLPPTCPQCGTLLRPSVLMFGDQDPSLLARLSAEAERYQAWEDAMESAIAHDPDLSLVVIEVGCGSRVPSVRLECESVVRDLVARGGRGLLVRINPEGPEQNASGDAGEQSDANVIVLRQSALAALTRLHGIVEGLGE